MEICRNQQWGTVCDNMWTNVDATVVCRHLGYSGFSMLKCNKYVVLKFHLHFYIFQMPKPSPMPSMVKEVD